MPADEHEKSPGRITLAMPRGPLRSRLQALFRERDLEVDLVDPEGAALDEVRDLAADVVVVRSTDLEEKPATSLDDLAGDDSAPDVVVIGTELDTHERTQLVADGAAEALDTDLLGKNTAQVIESLAIGSGGHLQPEEASVLPSLSDFASHSSTMHEFMDLVERVADTPATLLITGETGVGKEHLARAIHASSSRSAAPFISINCGALPDQLLESELFGHQKGAFTGAVTGHRGCFEQADGGTLLLDEIGEMPLHLQVKLLTARGNYGPIFDNDPNYGQSDRR